MDDRVFKLIAQRGENHLDFQLDYAEATAIFWVNPSKLNPTAFAVAITKCLQKINSWDIDLKTFFDACEPAFTPYDIELYLRSIVSAITRNPVSFKTKKPDGNVKVIRFIGLEKLNEEVTNIIQGEEKVKRWGEMPPNMLNSFKFRDEIVEKAQELGLEYQVIGWEELKNQGFNLICSVGENKKNSSLIILRESSQTSKFTEVKDRRRIVLIGKGICFDTGGLSIKVGNYMRTMKFDMTGAALVASIFLTMAKNGFSKDNEVIALIPISENLIGSDSTKVDSVLTAYGGKSVEISNTDAEGRLILADSISYASKKLEASEIITVATLTGAVRYALGSKYAGVWTSKEDSWDQLKVASDYSGDNIWRLPLDEYYLEELKSGISDLKNSATTGAGGASRAAAFLAAFKNKESFIHFDIANVSNTEGRSNFGLAPLFKTIYFYIDGRLNK
ncbi:M17 family metallopeptidase [Mycoplasma suis]|uniref:Probable cytosol aminopeptidase n=1 Tax=Mycoplasma suis (strain Illinois) TaxID=768700 RepID=F0QS76_MYCSL|nr:M17 family metallopeptidase [Mycoplasma suis]ADX98346.1 cytosol aminopeptidase [Mycoplasma suis str. Illinois]